MEKTREELTLISHKSAPDISLTMLSETGGTNQGINILNSLHSLVTGIKV